MAPGFYYQLRSPHWKFLKGEVEGRKRYELKREDVVLCADIVRRDGVNGRGRYAKLLHQTDDGDTISLFLRVSRSSRPPGTWRELNPMLVIALADKIPTL